MDISITRQINEWAFRHGWAADLARFFANDAVYLVVALAAIGFLAAGRYASRPARRGAVAAAFSLVIGLLLAQLIAGIVDRARPFVTHPDIHLLSAHARDAGFPSDHATGAFAIAVALLLRHRLLGAAALVVAVLIAVARVAVGAHYPTDVVAGAALGAAVALALFALPLRRWLDALADRCGAIYDRLLPTRRSAPGSAPG